MAFAGNALPWLVPRSEQERPGFKACRGRKAPDVSEIQPSLVNGNCHHWIQRFLQLPSRPHLSFRAVLWRSLSPVFSKPLLFAAEFSSSLTQGRNQDLLLLMIAQIWRLRLDGLYDSCWDSATPNMWCVSDHPPNYQGFTAAVFTSNALPIRTTERHITVGWCKEVSRDVLFSRHLITAISATSTKTASPSFRAVSWRRLSPVFSKHLLFTALTVCTIQIWTM